jgi:hypothetical protein
MPSSGIAEVREEELMSRLESLIFDLAAFFVPEARIIDGPIDCLSVDGGVRDFICSGCELLNEAFIA